MTALLSLLFGIMFVGVCYLVYGREQRKQSLKQTRMILRDKFTEEERNQRMIDAVKQSGEYDINRYDEEVVR
jgi:cbb3-type cytochrome oxidase subunit 3